MQKPLTLINEELTQNILNAINSSGIPLVFVEPVIKEISDVIHEGVRRQTEIDRENYARYLAEQAEKEKQAEEETGEQPEPEQEE